MMAPKRHEISRIDVIGGPRALESNWFAAALKIDEIYLVTSFVSPVVVRLTLRHIKTCIVSRLKHILFRKITFLGTVGLSICRPMQ
jgi:hypothetical protein